MPTRQAGDFPLTLVLLCHQPPPAERDGTMMEFGAQDKRGVLHAGEPLPDGSLRFILTVVARLAPNDTGVEFGGPFVHGVPRDRFCYLGYRAGGSAVWARRWKVPLATITDAQVREAQTSGRVLQVSTTAASGSTAPLLGGGWIVVAAPSSAEKA